MNYRLLRRDWRAFTLQNLEIVGSLNFRLEKFFNLSRKPLFSNSTRLGFSIIKETLQIRLTRKFCEFRGWPRGEIPRSKDFLFASEFICQAKSRIRSRDRRKESNIIEQNRRYKIDIVVNHLVLHTSL